MSGWYRSVTLWIPPLCWYQLLFWCHMKVYIALKIDCSGGAPMTFQQPRSECKLNCLGLYKICPAAWSFPGSPEASLGRLTFYHCVSLNGFVLKIIIPNQEVNFKENKNVLIKSVCFLEVEISRYVLGQQTLFWPKNRFYFSFYFRFWLFARIQPSQHPTGFPRLSHVYWLALFLYRGQANSNSETVPWFSKCYWLIVQFFSRPIYGMKILVKHCLAQGPIVGSWDLLETWIGS